MEVVITVINNGRLVSNDIIVVEKGNTDNLSKYARYFGPGYPNWSNMLYLKSQEKYADDLLKSRGHIFLNEIYDMLGFSRTKDECVVGWVLGSYVDFGLDNERNKYPLQRYLILDFNVDGCILDKI